MKGKFKVDPNKIAFMPAHFTPDNRYWQSDDMPYNDVDRFMIIYETDMEKLAEYIPENLELLSNKLIIVALNNNDVGFYGGRAYNILCVCAQVQFSDEKETIKGAYSLVMWENQMEPCQIGREFFGVPKLIGDVDRVVRVDDDFYCCASFNCHTFVKMRGHMPNVTSEEGLAKLNHGQYEWGINLRHLPRADSRGADFEDLVAYGSINHDHMQVTGTGEVEWIPLEDHEHPQQAHIIKAISELPILSPGIASYTKRSCKIVMSSGHTLKRII